MHILTGQNVYLAGPMDRATDGGIGWRTRVEDVLVHRFGIKVFNPAGNKHISGYEETEEWRKSLNEAKDQGDWDFVADNRRTRDVDLYLVDHSAFVILYCDMKAFPCGTFEEVFRANNANKPVLVVGAEGKKKIPTWLFWALDHNLFFDSFDELYRFLDDVHAGKEKYGKWIFFDNPLSSKHVPQWRRDFLSDFSAQYLGTM